MHLTREFNRAVIGLFLFALLLAGVSMILQVNNMYGLSLSGPNSVSRVLISQSIYIIEIFALWVAIAYITKEKTGAAIAFGLQLAMMLFTIYNFISRGVTEETIQTLKWSNMIVQLISYTAFGFIHFKKQSSLLMVLVAVVLTGMGTGFNPTEFYRFLDNLFQIAGWDDFMQLKLRIDHDSTRKINLFSPLMSYLFLPLKLITFWFIYTKIKFPHSFNKSLTIIPVTGYISQATFSVMYWVLRLSLFVTGMGIISFISQSDRTEISYMNIYAVLCFCLAVFVTGSIYRNFLVAYFISKGRYPGWLYFFLQIPVLNIFGWIITFFFKPKPIEESFYASTNAEPPAVPQSLIMMRVAQTRENYTYSAKNAGIKWLLIILLLLIWIIPNNPLRFGFEGRNGGLSGISLMIGIINFGLSLWYFFDRKALMPLFILQTVAVLVFYVTGYMEILHPILTFSLVNMVVYYALFHFDSFEFIEEHLTKT